MRPQPIALAARPRALARPQDLVSDAKPREWYRVQDADTGPARVEIFDAIDSWGPPFGISADGFIGDLRNVKASAIDLHVNSPGGDVWDGIAILNALIQHPAKVTAYVDGVAASIASVICMGADEVEMGLGAQLMIHDAMTVAIGNQAEMQAAADLLDKVSDNLAGVYAARTGQPAAVWRDRMRAETWFNADEAVAAGLAARMATPAPAEQLVASEERSHWARDTWRFSDRDHAPAPISSDSCTPADVCTEPPHSDPAPAAETPAAPQPVYDPAALVAALRRAVTA